jgi:hypothetical protein
MPSKSCSLGFDLKRSADQMNIIMTHVFTVATKASSGVNTPACPCASGDAEKSISEPFPAIWPNNQLFGERFIIPRFFNRSEKKPF